RPERCEPPHARAWTTQHGDSRLSTRVVGTRSVARQGGKSGPQRFLAVVAGTECQRMSGDARRGSHAGIGQDSRFWFACPPGRATTINAELAEPAEKTVCSESSA